MLVGTFGCNERCMPRPLPPKSFPFNAFAERAPSPVVRMWDGDARKRTRNSKQRAADWDPLALRRALTLRATYGNTADTAWRYCPRFALRAGARLSARRPVRAR